MLRLDDILVAVDFSECSTEGLRLAFRLAGRTGARVHLAFVQVVHADPFAPATYPADHRRRVIDAMKELAASAAGDSGMPPPEALETHVLVDSAVMPALDRFVRTHSVDLAIVGTHGRRGLRHWMLGSVAEEMVRALPCAVLTVRSDADVQRLLTGDGREVLVPVDFSDHSLEAVHAGREMAAHLQTGLRVLHVIEETLHPAFYNAGAFSIYDLQPDVEEKAWTHLRDVVERTPGPDVPVEYEVVDGRAATEIIRVASEREAALIVMSTHGLTGLAHLLIGSVADHVVRSAPCPTLVVKTLADGPFAMPLVGQSQEHDG